jgi:hypothetical protein
VRNASSTLSGGMAMPVSSAPSADSMGPASGPRTPASHLESDSSARSSAASSSSTASPG